ncbi:MAG: hypothetical protein JW720_15715 [Sedimentisphaerales bacterium]|nr:hypothetical protein [Sedimentisphaerales bacterium]
MYELLIRVETLCADAPFSTLFGIGTISIVAGLLLWLGGIYFSSAIIGILGAAIGSFCGLLVSQWLDTGSLLSMGIGAAVFCVAAVLLRNIIIIVLAVIIFALAGGVTYSSVLLGSSAPQEGAGEEPGLIGSFSHMDSATRLAYLNQISEQEQGFFERLKALLRETLGVMSPHKWKLILAVVVGGVGGYVLIRLLKKAVIALCCSGIGALLVLVGLQGFLMTGDLRFCGVFENKRFALTITYFSMVGIGTVIQLILARSPNGKQAQVKDA